MLILYKRYLDFILERSEAEVFIVYILDRSWRYFSNRDKIESMNYKFPVSMMNSILQGYSILDVRRLYIYELKDAEAFLKNYGYNLNDEQDVKELWQIYRQAMAFLKEELLDPDEEIPTAIASEEELKHIGHLLISVSTEEESEIKNWSCAILRVMHVLSHLNNGVFSTYWEEIQRQILADFEANLSSDPVNGSFLGTEESTDKIEIHKFESREQKTITSSTIKLLAKPTATAMSFYDRLGVRFITKNLFDAFRVLRFLIRENIVSVPNIMPDESKNTIYPFNLFLEIMEECLSSPNEVASAEINAKMINYLDEKMEEAEFKEKENQFSDQSYRAIKFIARKRIRINYKEERDLEFYYPFEVQIIDYDTYAHNLSGPAEHSKYKSRQREQARKRVFSFKVKEHSDPT